MEWAVQLIQIVKLKGSDLKIIFLFFENKIAYSKNT